MQEPSSIIPVPIIPVILCGGAGTRLWPISREGQAKQFLTLLGHESLLQQTARRVLRVASCAPSDVVTVSLQPMADQVRRHYQSLDPDLNKNILEEPLAKDTAAAVALAACHAERAYGPEAVLWVVPSDHFIADEGRLRDALHEAVNAARAGYLVTFGIEPTRPETGYGYIRKGAALNADSSGAALHVRRFVEKPDLETARLYIESGDYLWNSGMFVFTAAALIEAYEAHAPSILQAVQAGDYSSLDKIPFDKAIMEKSGQVAVIPSDPGWSDIGSWESLRDAFLARDEAGNAVKGSAVVQDCANSFIQGPGTKMGPERVIVCAGLENIVVIDTGDAVLVADITKGDSIKKAVARLAAESPCKKAAA